MVKVRVSRKIFERTTANIFAGNGSTFVRRSFLRKLRRKFDNTWRNSYASSLLCRSLRLLFANSGVDLDVIAVVVDLLVVIRGEVTQSRPSRTYPVGQFISVL